jgi:serine protease Do
MSAATNTGFPGVFKAGRWTIGGTLLLLTLYAPGAAPAQDEADDLKPRLYTTGSTIRGCFSEVCATARQSTVQVLSNEEWVALGVVVGEEGWVLTKASQLGDTLTCKLPSREIREATLVATDEATDLALLKIESGDLQAIEWLTGTDPSVGQWVVTPGLRSTPEAIGIVGATCRRIELERVSGVLGIALEGDDNPPKVTQVYEGTAAEAAGVRAGDTVVEVDGRKLTSRASLINYVREHAPGDELSLKIRRGEETIDLQATLMYPEHDEFLSRITVQNQMGGDLSRRRTGFPSVFPHDSVITPQDCGGPVIGLDGKAFGLNIARAGRTETLALPADVVVPLIEELKLRAPATNVSME